MLIDGKKDYAPLLHLRQSETRALFHLPGQTKDRIFPVIVARPWPNAKLLALAWQRIDEAFPDRPFALDLDDTRRGIPSSRPANAEFDELFKPDGGFRNYFDCVQSLEFAVPVLRPTDSEDLLLAQIKSVNSIGRGAVIRVRQDSPASLTLLKPEVFSGIDDLLTVVDAGWSRDLLQSQAWCSSIIRKASDLREEPEIVVTGGSFPDSFSKIGDRGSFEVLERELYSVLRARHNEARMIYGDWASTRPPSREASGGGSIPPRIDIPHRNYWWCFRAEGDDERYREVASRATHDPEWLSSLRIWGTFMIASTADGKPQSIRSQSMAASVRINIHLHTQAFFDDPSLVQDGEEPFED